DQVLQLTFNQAVSPSAVQATLDCRIDKNRFELVQAKPPVDPFKDNHSADVDVQRKLYEERNVYLRSAKPLPLDTAITCTLPKGFQGAEGPLLSDKPYSFMFRTYAPLKMLELRCGYPQRCTPNQGIYIRFNNTLDGEQDAAERIHLAPEVADL